MNFAVLIAIRSVFWLTEGHDFQFELQNFSDNVKAIGVKL